MPFISRTLAFLIMGAIWEALIGAPISMFLSARQLASDSGIAYSIGLFGVVIAVALVALYVGVSSPTPRIAWRRMLVVAALASFLLPIDAIAFVAAVPVGDGSTKVGASLIAALMLGFVGFFLGIAFAVAAHFARNEIAPAR